MFLFQVAVAVSDDGESPGRFDPTEEDKISQYPPPCPQPTRSMTRHFLRYNFTHVFQGTSLAKVNSRSVQRLQRKKRKLQRKQLNSQSSNERKQKQKRFSPFPSLSSLSFSIVVNIQREAQLDFALEYYGKLPLNQSQSRPSKPRHQIASLSPQLDGQAVVIRARVHTLRAQGNRMVFFNLRQRTDSVQAILSVEDGKVSKFMVKWASGLASESIVLVEAIVQKSPEEIKSATIKDVELILTRVCMPPFRLRH